jgi:hypothetical protein
MVERKMSRILSCTECGFYISFGHSRIHHWFSFEEVEEFDPKKHDPFYFYNTSCPKCGKHFWTGQDPDTDNPKYLPFDEFAQKVGSTADIVVTFG